LSVLSAPQISQLQCKSNRNSLYFSENRIPLTKQRPNIEQSININQTLQP